MRLLQLGEHTLALWMFHSSDDACVAQGCSQVLVTAVPSAPTLTRVMEACLLTTTQTPGVVNLRLPASTPGSDAPTQHSTGRTAAVTLLAPRSRRAAFLPPRAENPIFFKEELS